MRELHFADCGSIKYSQDSPNSTTIGFQSNPADHLPLATHMTPDNPITSMSLIDQVRSENAEAWSKLAHIYYPLVFHWAKRAGMQDSDAADIVQDVFSIVFKSISRFHKDRPADTFRGWLWTITRNEIRGWFRKQKAMQAKARGGTDANLRISSVADWVNDDSEIHEIESSCADRIADRPTSSRSDSRGL